MAVKWVKTGHKGLRYYEHPTRKHGKRLDRYYSIRIKVSGKDYTYGVGWVSDGIPEEAGKNNPHIGFEDYCVLQRNFYLGNLKERSGAQSPKERRKLADERRLQEQEEVERKEKEAITLADYFDKKYIPDQEGNKKPNSIRVEKNLFDGWVRPLIGDTPLISLVETDLGRVKKNLIDGKRADKTIHHTLAVIRQILNHAKHPEVYLRAKVKMPKVDNAKLRYLTPAEIEVLLRRLKLKSEIVHDQAFLSVNCGLRWSETVGLRWEDVNYKTGSMSIRDSKTGSRTVFINEGVAAMLKARQGQNKKGAVFPAQDRCSKTFQRVADELFNENITDRRLRITFHSLRHTFGTYVYQNSGDLYLTQKALGHKTLVMAQRYAKMSEPKLREAFNGMTNILKQGQSENKENVVNFPTKG